MPVASTTTSNSPSTSSPSARSSTAPAAVARRPVIFVSNRRSPPASPTHARRPSTSAVRFVSRSASPCHPSRRKSGGSCRHMIGAAAPALKNRKVSDLSRWMVFTSRPARRSAAWASASICTPRAVSLRGQGSEGTTRVGPTRRGPRRARPTLGDTHVPAAALVAVPLPALHDRHRHLEALRARLPEQGPRERQPAGARPRHRHAQGRGRRRHRRRGRRVSGGPRRRGSPPFPAPPRPSTFGRRPTLSASWRTPRKIDLHLAGWTS